jgi:CDP-paratose 2-epimerase
LKDLPNYRHHAIDIRDAVGTSLLKEYGAAIRVIVHAAGQPSHDRAARAPAVDFGVNAVGTLNMLEAARQHCPDAVFIFTSTSKVYGWKYRYDLDAILREIHAACVHA